MSDARKLPSDVPHLPAVGLGIEGSDAVDVDGVDTHVGGKVDHAGKFVGVGGHKEEVDADFRPGTSGRVAAFDKTLHVADDGFEGGSLTDAGKGFFRGEPFQGSNVFLYELPGLSLRSKPGLHN